MRCVICDASDQGLSNYRPDGHFHAKAFHRIGDDLFCDECSNEIDDTLNDFYEEDENEDD